MPETSETTYVLVPDLPDLITEEDYLDPATDATIRVRISFGQDGIEILGDSPRPARLEELLKSLGPRHIERTPCG
jgi:hypothetical protein